MVSPVPSASPARPGPATVSSRPITHERTLEPDILQAIFALAGDSPNDQQQFSYHLWTQSTPGHMGLPELRRAFATLMAEVSRRGEIILDEATPARRRALLAIAVREDEESRATLSCASRGLRRHSSLTSAMRAYLKGNNAILEKRGSKVRYRERFMRLWMLLQVIRNPSIFPAARDLPPAAEYSLLCPYFSDRVKDQSTNTIKFLQNAQVLKSKHRSWRHIARQTTGRALSVHDWIRKGQGGAPQALPSR